MSTVRVTVGETELAVELETRRVTRVDTTGPRQTDLPTDPEAARRYVEAVRILLTAPWEIDR